MALSAVGSIRLKVYAVLLLVNTSILAVSAHVNNFQKFFYRADIFPFAMSIATMVFVSTMVFMDIKFKNIVTARPPFELGWLIIFGTLWLISNAFSTSRWKYANTALCQTIPSGAQYAPYHTWCNELQALRVLVWIEWVMFLCIFAYLLRWTIKQRNSGRFDVWSTAFSRSSVQSSTQFHHRGETNSEFLQWEKFPSPPISQSPLAGNQEFVRDSYNNAEQSQYEQHLEPQYSQSLEPQYTQSLEAQYPQYPEAQYAHSLQGPHPIEVPYMQHPQGQYIPPSQAHSLQGPHPIEVPYMQHPQGQYIPPSQAQFTHFPQPYLSGPDHVL